MSQPSSKQGRSKGARPQGQGGAPRAGKDQKPQAKASGKASAQRGSKPADRRVKSANRGSKPAANEQAYSRLILMGSPRADGRTALLAQEVFEACVEECPQDECRIVSVATQNIYPCVGCGACRPESGKADSVFDEEGMTRCTIDDDMEDVYASLEECDELIIVAPLYFAGPAAPFKALLDRFQPFFWTDARHGTLRPAILHIIGEGNDPFGFDPLVTCVESAILCAGFQLTTIFDWVGCINPDGTIVQDAQEYRMVDDDGSYDEDADCAAVDYSALSAPHVIRE